MGNMKAVVPIALSLVIAVAGTWFIYQWMQGQRTPAEVVQVQTQAVPIAVAGTVGYVWAGWNQPIAPGMLGYVYLPALGAVVAASMLTAPLGVRSVHALPAATAKKLFAGLLYALATYMLWKALTGRAG